MSLWRCLWSWISPPVFINFQGMQGSLRDCALRPVHISAPTRFGRNDRGRAHRVSANKIIGVFFGVFYIRQFLMYSLDEYKVGFAVVSSFSIICTHLSSFDRPAVCGQRCRLTVLFIYLFSAQCYLFIFIYLFIDFSTKYTMTFMI